MRTHPRFAKSITGAVLSLGALFTVFNPAASAAARHRHAPARSLTVARRDARQRGRHEAALSRAKHAARRRATEAARAAAIVIAPAGGVWRQLRICESADNYREDTGNGYYGAYQFSLSTWHSMGGQGFPDNASTAVQDALARRLQATSGWRNWPSCSMTLGLT